MDNTYRERPTVKGNYTKQDLVDYALWRKNDEIANLEKVQEWKDQEENTDKGYEDNEEYREPLSMEKETWIDITLSTGGDADGYKIKLEHNGKYWEATKGYYWWADWGVYEEVPLSDEELELVSNVYYPEGLLDGVNE